MGTQDTGPQSLSDGCRCVPGTVVWRVKFRFPVVLRDGGVIIKWSGSGDGCGLSCSDVPALLVSVNQETSPLSWQWVCYPDKSPL